MRDAAEGRRAMQDKSDETLLRELGQGHGRALEELARRYERQLLGVAMGMMGGRRDLARDAVQESWVRVIRFAAGFNGQCQAKTWLYQIVMNQCWSLHTAIAGRREKTSDASCEGSSIESTRSVEDDAIRSERAFTLRDAVGRLADEKREVILLCYHEGLTHEEAADVLGIPIGTVKSRLHAALEALRAMLSLEMDR